MPLDSAEQFILEQGYKEYPQNSRQSWQAEKFFQKTFRTEADHKSYKRFIAIYQWDTSRVLPAVTSKTYEVEAAFETSTEELWWTGKFYSINADQLRRLLPMLETMHWNVFQVLGGIYQD